MEGLPEDRREMAAPLFSAHTRELLWIWTTRQVKARYTQTVFGAAWAVFQPLALSAVFVLVFSYIVRVQSEGIPYPIFVYSTVLPWTLFSRAVAAALTSIVANMSIVTKIY